MSRQFDAREIEEVETAAGCVNRLGITKLLIPSLWYISVLETVKSKSIADGVVHWQLSGQLVAHANTACDHALAEMQGPDQTIAVTFVVTGRTVQDVV